MADEQTDKYVLLRGKTHNNVFWTPNKDIDPKKFEVLFTGNTSEEMITEWNKYNPELAAMCDALDALKELYNE